MDALSETLRVVRLSGAIFFNARFTAPWGYGSGRPRRWRPCWNPAPRAW